MALCLMVNPSEWRHWRMMVVIYPIQYHCQTYCLQMHSLTSGQESGSSQLVLLGCQDGGFIFFSFSEDCQYPIEGTLW